MKYILGLMERVFKTIIVSIVLAALAVGFVYLVVVLLKGGL